MFLGGCAETYRGIAKVAFKMVFGHFLWKCTQVTLVAVFHEMTSFSAVDW